MLNDDQMWGSLIQEAIGNKAEYNFLDFKLNLSEKNERLKEHINAFGNLEQGGCFVFGVDNQFPIVSIDDDWDNITQKLTNLCKKSQEPPLDVNVFPIKINKQSVLCVHVLSGKTKPVFIKDRAPLGGSACFKRTGSSTVNMSIEEIKDLLVSSKETYLDETPINKASINDLNFDTLIELLPGMNKTSLLSEKNISMLQDAKIITGLKQAAKVTVAGWLCFAKDPQSIREFRNAYIEFQVFKGNARNNPVKKYEIKGSLPEQIERSIELLQQHIWLVPKITGAKREDIPAYSRVVLREIITNSVVHRDYKKMHQPVKIAMLDNRIEIENPGGLMPGLTPYNLIHRRDWRNPLLAELMKKFGFGEMDGQGIDRLYDATLTIKIPPPIFTNRENTFSVTLSVPKQFEEYTPEEKSLTIIILAIMREPIDNETIRHCFDISSEKASTLIKLMVTNKVLEANSSSRKYAKYVLTKTLHDKIFN